ncbi:MAG: DUF3089 domain-containing protein [Hyphomicrobiaceae bacterium]
MRYALRLSVVALCLLCSGPSQAQLASLFPPKTPFDQMRPPPPPDYAQPSGWAVWPGVVSAADTVPEGATPGRASAPSADVFFIHPTTFLGNDAWNAPFDADGFTGQQLNETVLGNQVSIFNACCRMFAPRYRQATISAFLRPSADSFKAYGLAYSDVLRAFDHYLQQQNNGRPFILASHSQGSLHATRLIQERIANDPALGRRLVAAYVVGASLPETFKTGLPVCTSATQTGCLIDWNSASSLTPLALGRGLMVTWSKGRYQAVGLNKWLCVNPLSWDRTARSPASKNLGALPFAGLGKPVPPLRSGVTGARCTRGRLVISIPRPKRDGFTDVLTKLGSYHNLDYALFYDSVRRNAVDRVEAFGRSAGR